MDIKIVKDFKMTNCVMERMELLCGAMNYSLALRNSEHAARYILFLDFDMIIFFIEQ